MAIEYQTEGNGKNLRRELLLKDFAYLLMPDRFSNGDTKMIALLICAIPVATEPSY